MKIGVKVWPDNAEYAYEIAEHADFIEIMAKRGCEFSFLEEIDLPFVVHAEHGLLGVNCADSTKAALCKESLEFAMKIADKVSARVIIAHPGFLDGSPNTKAENVIDFMKDVKDSRVILENLMLIENMKGAVINYPFSAFEPMKQLLAATGKDMCLDFSHTNCTAVNLGIDYMELLEKFMQLKPRHFHACGGIEGRAEDLHLHLWEGNLNIEAYKRLLPKNAWVTLETPTDLEGQIKDIEIMKS